MMGLSSPAPKALWAR